MKRIGALLLIACCVAQPSVLLAANALRFIRKIGVPWNDASREWMSYVAFSPDGEQIASDGPGPDGNKRGLSIWNFPSGKFVKSLDNSIGGISPGWHYYIGKDGLIDIRADKALLPLSKYPVYAFSSDDLYFADYAIAERGGHPGIRIVSLPSARQVASIKGVAFSLAISPGDHTLAVGRWNSVTLWNMQTGQRAGVLHGIGRYASSLAFSKDGQLLAIGKDFGGIEIWNVRRHKRIHAIHLDGGDASVAFSPDGRSVAFGLYGWGTAFLADVVSGKVVGQAKISDIGCGSIAFSPNGRYLIAPSTGGLITWPYDDGGGTIHVYRIRHVKSEK